MDFFGHKAKKKRKKEKVRNAAQQRAQQEEIDRLKALGVPSQQTTVNQIAEEQRQADIIGQERKSKEQAAREEGRKYAEDVLGREYHGLNPKQRLNLQESANAQINRDIQGYRQKLHAQQGRRGVRGGSGTAHHQERELARLGQETQGQFQRDLSELDAELALRKAAAAFNIEQGNVGQEIQRNQAALNTLQSYDQKKYQKYLAEQANRLFQRI